MPQWFFLARLVLPESQLQQPAAQGNRRFAAGAPRKNRLFGGFSFSDDLEGSSSCAFACCDAG